MTFIAWKKIQLCLSNMFGIIRILKRKSVFLFFFPPKNASLVQDYSLCNGISYGVLQYSYLKWKSEKKVHTDSILTSVTVHKQMPAFKGHSFFKVALSKYIFPTGIAQIWDLWNFHVTQMGIING